MTPPRRSRGCDAVIAHPPAWERADTLQPLRELLERSLVCWAGALVVPGLVIKPRLDQWINDELAGVIAAAHGDPLLRSIHFSLGRDAEWHRAWTTAAARIAVTSNVANGELVRAREQRS